MKHYDPSFFENPDNLRFVQNSYLDKVKERKYSVLHNPITGEYIYPIAPFRGNPAHARRKRKKLEPLIDSFGDCEFSTPLKGARASEVRYVKSILITLTFCRLNAKAKFTRQGFPTKPVTSYEAWNSLKGSKSLLNQFKVEMSRVFGSSYGSCTVKEGSKDNYPAPHMIVIFDKPVIAHRWGKQWLVGKVHDRSLVDKIQASWERIAGAHCKINAIIDSKAFSYVFKYIKKSVNCDADNVRSMSASELVCFNTHLNHAVHNLNDVISPAFMEKLNYVKEITLLDKARIKLKHARQRRNKILKDNVGIPLAFLQKEEGILFRSLNSEIERLQGEIHILKMEYSPWFFISAGFTSLDAVEEFIISIV